MTRYKVTVTYTWEVDLECSADDLLTAIQDDPILHTQDYQPTITIIPKNKIVSQKID